MIALPEFIKYPSPFAAVNVAVFGVVCQSTEPDLPNPDCVAPDAKAIVSPLAPIVIVLLFSLIMFCIARKNAKEIQRKINVYLI